MSDFIDVDSLPINHPVRTDAISPLASSSYSRTSLEDIVRVVEPLGYKIYTGKGSHAGESRRNRRGIESGKSPETAFHSICLRSIYDTPDVIIGKTLGQLFLSDSHDLSSPISVGVNLWEYWCSNGATKTNGGWSFKVKHIGINMDAIIDAVKLLVLAIPSYLDWIETLKSVDLTSTQALRFADLAKSVRFDDDSMIPQMDLLRWIYPQQKNPTLWNVFQNVQRNLMEGNVIVTSSNGKTRKSKALTATKGIVQMNDALWTRLEEFVTDEFPSVALPRPPFIDLDPSQFRIKSDKLRGPSAIVGSPMTFDA